MENNKRKNSPLVYFILAFITAVFFELYWINIHPYDYFMLIGIGLVVLITGYLSFDGIIKMKSEADELKREQNETMIKAQKAIYLATKKNAAEAENMQIQSLKAVNVLMDRMVETITERQIEAKDNSDEPKDLTGLINELSASNTRLAKEVQNVITVNQLVKANEDLIKNVQNVLSGQPVPKPATDPEPIVVPEPTITPEPIVVPEPAITPEPIVVPEPAITPEPIVVPEPTVDPEPVETPETITNDLPVTEASFSEEYDFSEDTLAELYNYTDNTDDMSNMDILANNTTNNNNSDNDINDLISDTATADDIAKGNIDNSSITEGNVTQNSIAESNTIQDSITKGNAIQSSIALDEQEEITMAPMYDFPEYDDTADLPTDDAISNDIADAEAAVADVSQTIEAMEAADDLEASINTADITDIEEAMENISDDVSDETGSKADADNAVSSIMEKGPNDALTPEEIAALFSNL